VKRCVYLCPSKSKRCVFLCDRYSKKEVKTQRGYAANMSGIAQSRPDDYSVASRSVLNRCVFVCPSK